MQPDFTAVDRVSPRVPDHPRSISPHAQNLSRPPRASVMYGQAVRGVVLTAIGCGLALGAGCRRETAAPGDWQGRDIGPAQANAIAALRERGGLRGAPEVPSTVTDQAAILDDAQARQLRQELDAYHAETCHQFVLVTVKSLNGERIDDYSLALSNQLRLGYAGFNNGLMMLVAPNERAVRIEVGRGLEDVISDEAAREILRDKLMPAYRQGAYAAGSRAGMQELMKLARKKGITAPHRPAGCP